MLVFNRFRGKNQGYEKAKEERKIDEGCIPFCDLLNRIGLFTRFCCEGHEPEDEFISSNQFFRILFDNSLTDSEMFAFMQILNEVGEIDRYCAKGRFEKWYRYIEGVLIGTWVYEISVGHKETKECIMRRELERFQKAEELFHKKIANFERAPTLEGPIWADYFTE